MSVMNGQLSGLALLAVVALIAASWSCSNGAELINDLVDSSHHHLPYDSFQGDPRESNWDDSTPLSEEKRLRSQSWRMPPSDWVVDKRYMRFGRSSNDGLEDVDAAYPNEEEKRYMRFGKRYMRFGRRAGPVRGRDIF